jgi:hypothetical protein
VVVLLTAMDATADAQIVTVPLLLAGLGIGALASQLGAVTVSAVPDEDSPAVGGLQNTATNLGAALGTALAGSILIASLSASFLQGVQGNPAIPQQLQTQATVQLASGVPFVSDAQLQTALAEAGVPPDATAAAIDVNRDARVAGLRSALAVLALIAMIGLFAARRIPREPVTGSPETGNAAPSSRAARRGSTRTTAPAPRRSTGPESATALRPVKHRHTRRVNMSRFTSGQVRHQASLLDPLGGDHPQIRSSRDLVRAASDEAPIWRKSGQPLLQRTALHRAPVFTYIP